MTRFWTGLAKSLAGVCTVLFVITAVMALFLFNMNRKLFDSRLYKNALSESNVYEKLPALVGQMLVSGATYNPCAENPVRCEEISPELHACYQEALGGDRFLALSSGQDEPTDVEKQKIQICYDEFGQAAPPGESGMPAFMQNLSDEDWAAVMAIILPPDEMKTMANSVFDGVFAYLRGEVNQVTISLASLKARLASPAGEELILQILAAQPPCTPEELSQLFAVMYTEEIVFCSPPEELMPVVVPLLEIQLQIALADIPDEAVIIEPYVPDPSAADAPFGGDPVATVRAVRLILGLTPILPLLFLAAVTLLGVRSLKGWMRWWGIPFLAAGVFGLGMGLVSTPLLLTLWNTFLVPRIPPFLPVAVTDLGEEILRAVAHGLAEPIILQSLILLIVGVGAWIGSYFIKAGTAPQAAPRPS